MECQEASDESRMSLLDSDSVDALLARQNLPPALIPEKAPKREVEGRFGEDAFAGGDGWSSTDWMSALTLTVNVGGATMSPHAAVTLKKQKPWHSRPHGPPISRPRNANATNAPVRQRDFKVVRIPKETCAKILTQGDTSDQPDQPLREGDTSVDMEDRRDHRRSGGGGRYAGQKRRFREDDDYDRRPAQRRYERPEYPSVRARRLVWTIADNPIRNAQEDVADIAKLLCDSAEDEIFCDRVSNDIVQILQEQPFKIPFVASIILYTNLQKPDFVQMILTKATKKLNALIEAGEWRAFKLLLRFFACMQPLFEGEGCLPLLDELFNKAADLQSASSDDTLGLELVKIIMLTLPYVVSSAKSDFTQHASELLSKTDIIASAPREFDALINPWVAIGDEAVRETPSVISLLQKQLQHEAENNWPLSFIPRLFEIPQPAEGQEQTPHRKYPFPVINLPQTINPGKKPLFPELYFSVYADQDIETVPSTSHLASCLLRDSMVDTIGLLDFNRTAAAKFLTDLDCYLARETFVPRATPFDKIKDIPEGKPKWKPEDLAVDALFSQIMQLPGPEHKLVYYHSMITETCKIAPGAIAPSLGRAIRFLYSNMSNLDLELGQRFMDWFSHHLSNFDFQWKWKEWIEDVKLDPLYPQKAFILGALDKEVRLSFAKRIRQTLPNEYQPLISSSQDNDIPEFKYNNELTPYSAEAKQLVRLLRKKASDSEVEPILTTIASASEKPDEASDSNNNPSDNPDALIPAVDAFTTTICYIGSKSLSHVLSHIERQKERLSILSASGPEAQKQIISSVVAYWRAVQPGVAVNIIDKLLNYMILTPTSVVEWALDPIRIRGGRSLACSWIYEMVERTLRKVTGRVRQIVAARLQQGLPVAQVEVLEKALSDETDALRVLFGTIDDALAPVAEGFADSMIESDDPNTAGFGIGDEIAGSEEQQRLCQLWGSKWRRVFSRKLQVEEMVMSDSAKSFPPAAEEDPIVLANGGAEADGHTEVNGGNLDDEMNGTVDVDVDLDIS